MADSESQLDISTKGEPNYVRIARRVGVGLGDCNFCKGRLRKTPKTVSSIIFGE